MSNLIIKKCCFCQSHNWIGLTCQYTDRLIRETTIHGNDYLKAAKVIIAAKQMEMAGHGRPAISLL